jgi:hypothetical protein
MKYSFTKEDSETAQYLMDMDYAVENSHQEDLDLQKLHISTVPMYDKII